MYCENCGAKIDDHANFCENCGAAYQRGKSKKQQTKTKYLILGIAVLCAIIGLVILLFVGIFSASKKKQGGITFLDNYYEEFSIQQTSGEWIKGFYDQKGNVIEYRSDDNEYIKNIRYSGTQESVVYTYENEVYFLQNGSAENIFSIKENAESMEQEEISYKISFNGSTVALQSENILYLYVDGIEKNMKISDVAAGNYVLSSDGEYVLYVKESQNALYCVKVNDENSQKKISDNVTAPLTVADSGKDFFYLGNDTKLYYSDGKKEKCLSDFSISNVEKAEPCYFNQSCNEVVYHDGTVTYYYKAGDMEKKIIGRDLNSCHPYCFNEMAVQRDSIAELKYYDYNIMIYGKDTFAESLFYDQYEHYWLGADVKELVSLDSLLWPMGSIQISEDNQNMIYIQSGMIYQMDMKTMKGTCIYDNDDVRSFSVSTDFKELYVYTQAGSVKYVNLKNTEKVQELAQISDVYYAGYNKSHQAYMICTHNKELYKITSKEVKLLSTEACQVNISERGAVTYIIYDEYDAARAEMILDDEIKKVIYTY